MLFVVVVLLLLLLLFLLSQTGSLPYSNANFGQGIGPVQFSYSQCTGSEGRLVDCPSGSVGGCNHDHDAGVRCQMKTGD